MHKIDTNFGDSFVCGHAFNAANCKVGVYSRGYIVGNLHWSNIAYSYDRLTADNVEFDEKIIEKAQAFAQGSVATVNSSKARIDRVIVLSLQGYNTVTTRARLNGIAQALNCKFSFVSRQFDARILYNGKYYDSIVIRVAGLLIVATVYPVSML
jgi:hypothetical protein